MPSVHGCWLARKVIAVPLYFFQSNAADAAGLALADAAAPLGEGLGDAAGDGELVPCPAQPATNIAIAVRDSRFDLRLVISLPPPSANAGAGGLHRRSRRISAVPELAWPVSGAWQPILGLGDFAWRDDNIGFRSPSDGPSFIADAPAEAARPSVSQ